MAAQQLAETMHALETLKLLFLLIPFLCGMLTGFQYPLGNSLYLQRSTEVRETEVKSTDVSRTAGLLYALDLAGGWAGGVAGGVALLPVLGLTGTCVTVGLLKLAGFAVFSWTRR
jgi:spermidine synthase